MDNKSDVQEAWEALGAGPRFVCLTDDIVRGLVARVLARLPEEVSDWVLDDWGEEALYFYGPLASSVLSYPTEDHKRTSLVLLDSELKQMPTECSLAVIAHEIAHLWQGHHRLGEWQRADISLEQADEEENAADALAESWGFDIDAMRQWEGNKMADWHSEIYDTEIECALCKRSLVAGVICYELEGQTITDGEWSQLEANGFEPGNLSLCGDCFAGIEIPGKNLWVQDDWVAQLTAAKARR